MRGFYATRHTTRVVTENEFRSDLPAIFEAMDQPTIDGINIWFVSKAAHELGLKVAISGLGGDELFGGYSSFRDLPSWVRWMAAPSSIPFLGQVLRRAFRRMHGERSGVSPKTAGIVELGGSYPGAYLLAARHISCHGSCQNCSVPISLGRALSDFDPIDHIACTLAPDPVQPFARVATLEASLYMRNQLLRDTDWASMAHSLEVRVPLVDTELLRSVAPIMCGKPRTSGKELLASNLPPCSVGSPSNAGKDWLPHADRHVAGGAQLSSNPILKVAGSHWSRRWLCVLPGQFGFDTLQSSSSARPYNFGHLTRRRKMRESEF